jgi:hypothetical protein
MGKWHQGVGVEREPPVRRLNEKAAPAPHTLFGELPLPLNPADMLNYRVAENNIEAACLEIGGAPIADNVSSPRSLIIVFVHVKDGELRALAYHRPIESATPQIQHSHSSINVKTIRKQGHAAFAEVLKYRAVEGVHVHSPTILQYYRPMHIKLAAQEFQQPELC